MAKTVGLTFPKVNDTSKEELLKRAEELGLEVKPNIGKAKLEALIKEAEEAAAKNGE